MLESRTLQMGVAMDETLVLVAAVLSGTAPRW